MENIKVSVKQNDWSEVFDMFVELGVTHRTYKEVYKDNNGWLFVYKDTVWVGLFPHERKECREVTFSELKDMVVLNRNDLKDATHAGCTIKSQRGYLTSDGEEYFWNYDLSKWNKLSLLTFDRQDLKPIEEKGMQEFLVNYDNKWTLQLLDADTEENSYRVAVPLGADVYWEEDGYYWFTTQLMGYRDARMVWQRSEDFTKVTIDGVEAFNAIANDITVQYKFAGGEWKDYTQDLNHEGSKLKAVHFLCGHCEFRYKPKTIVVNGVEYEDEQKAVQVVQDYFKGYIK